RERLYAMADDADLHVRYQLAFTLGELAERKRNTALANLARRDVADKWMRLAIASSLGKGAGGLFAELAGDAQFRRQSAAADFLEDLARQIGAQKQVADVAALIKTLQGLSAEDEALAQVIVRGVTRGAGNDTAIRDQLAAATGGKAAELLENLVQQSLKTAADEKQALEARVQAVRSLSVGKFGTVKSGLVGLLSPREPQSLQLAALATLGQFDADEV